MASDTSNYCGTKTTNASSYGIARCKWKPRKISAHRDFPQAFNEVNMNNKLSGVQPPVLIDEPKGPKVSVVPESPNKIGGDLEDNKGLVEYVQGSSDTGMFDFIPLETDCESSGSSDSTEDFDSDDDVIPHIPTEHQEADCVEFINTHEVTRYKKRSISAVRCWPPGCGPNVRQLSDEELEKEIAEKRNHWLTCKNCRSDDAKEEEADNGKQSFDSDYGVIPHMITEHEEPDRCEFINTDKVTCYKKRKFSATRCWPPGCGRNLIHLSDEELEEEFTEKKNHWLDEEEEEEEADNGKQNFNSDYDVITEHEEPERGEFINTDKVTRYKKRKCSATRCWPPGCGRKLIHLSDEELEKEFTERKNHWLTCKNCRSDDAKEEEEEEASDKGTQSAAMFGPCTELKFHGVCVKEMRCYQIQGELKIELSVANLEKDSISVEFSGKNEHTNTSEQPQLSRLVSAVRSFPPGCGN